MFAFLVRRILSGFLIVVMVSMLVYTLFWYGPKSPALELCRRDTNGRCGPDSPRLEEYEDAARVQQPHHRGVRQVGQGPVRGPDDHDRRH